MLKLLVFVLFPIIRISKFPFPVSVLYVFFTRDLKFKKSYFYPLFYSSLYLLVIIALNNYKDLNMDDLIYFIFPLIYLLLIHIFINIKDMTKIIKIYFFANLFVAFITGIGFLPKVLEKYYELYVFGNITSANHYLNFPNRTIGLIGHPAWLALMEYLLGKFLSIKEDDYKYVLMSVVAIMFSAGRAALVILAILEFYDLVVRQKKDIIKLFRNMILVIILIFVIFILIYKFNSSFKFFIDITIEDLKSGTGFRSSSISHRLSMFSLLFNQNLLTILFGKASILSSIEGVAIDTEFVMRTLQFGLIGFIILFLPILIAYCNSKKAKNQIGEKISVFLFLFCILGSLTTTIISNMIFIIYISIIISIIEQMNEKVAKKGFKE